MVFDHPAMFETLAMEPEKKKEIDDAQKRISEMVQ